jgi:hypothetical protein
MDRNILSENQRRVYQLEDLEIYEGIILKCIIKLHARSLGIDSQQRPELLHPDRLWAAPSFVFDLTRSCFPWKKAAGS